MDGKVFITQDAVKIELVLDGDLPSNISSVKIGYQKPTGAKGEWNAILDTPNKTIYKIFNLNEFATPAGIWTFWGIIIYSDGKRQPTTSIIEPIYIEGQ